MKRLSYCAPNPPKMPLKRFVAKKVYVTNLAHAGIPCFLVFFGAFARSAFPVSLIYLAQHNTPKSYLLTWPRAPLHKPKVRLIILSNSFLQAAHQNICALCWQKLLRKAHSIILSQHNKPARDAAILTDSFAVTNPKLKLNNSACHLACGFLG